MLKQGDDFSMLSQCLRVGVKDAQFRDERGYNYSFFNILQYNYFAFMAFFQLFVACQSYMLQPEALCSVTKAINMAQNVHSPVTMDTQWQALSAEFVRRI